MEIRLAEKQNLLEVLYILKECSLQLMEKGVRYWNNSLVDYNDISTDIQNKYVYILFYNKIPVATITIKPHKSIPGMVVLSRMAVYPAFQKRGYAKNLLEFAEDFARNNKSYVLKGVSPVDDKAFFQLLEELGYENKGIDTEPVNDYERIIFEKELR